MPAIGIHAPRLGKLRSVQLPSGDQFRSGERYLYFQLPPTCYQQLLQADSKGAYFNHNIRNRFPSQHLSHPSAPLVLAALRKTK